MTPEELRRLLSGTTLSRLETGVAARLVPLLYSLGLLCVLVWAVGHLFLSFALTWSNGLWGILEIVVFGFTAVIALRIGCELLLKVLQPPATQTDATRAATLLDDVRDAIRDLAEAEEDGRDAAPFADPDEVIVPPPPLPQARLPSPRPRPARRTAKRTVKTPRNPM